MKVTGVDGLKLRLKAIRQTFKVGAKLWAQETVGVMRPSVPRRSGRLADSFRVRNATQRRAVVGGHYSAYFVDAGTKAHIIKPKRSTTGGRRGRGGSRTKGARVVFQGTRGTIFAKRVDHPTTRAQPFRQRSADEGLRRRPLSATLFRLWNRAA